MMAIVGVSRKGWKRRLLTGVFVCALVAALWEGYALPQAYAAVEYSTEDQVTNTPV